jgi:AcrR family transcriptional regulator
MARWEAGADARLAKAAIELYLERGFEQVTVAEIAGRAGLTKRTFFRYFSDKREVLFAGSAAFQDAVVSAVIDAPDDVTPIDAVAAALAAGGAELTQLGEPVRRRQHLIAASTDLQEREMIKLAALTAAVADALRQRGLPDTAATLTAQAGIAVFTTAFERWSNQDEPADFPALLRGALSDLRTAISGQ